MVTVPHSVNRLKTATVYTLNGLIVMVCELQLNRAAIKINRPGETVTY